MALKQSLTAFAATSLGRAVLIAVAILVLAATFWAAGPYIAIIALLVTGLGIPIYAGWKRPRHLALVGLIAILIAAPIADALIAPEVFSRPPAASSLATSPFGNGGAVLTDAQATPYNGAPGENYTFSVNIHTQNLSPNQTIQWLFLFVSTCPGATTPDEQSCPGGYPYYSFNTSFVNKTVPSSYVFSEALPGTNIWSWQMAAVTKNATGNLTWIFVYLPGADTSTVPGTGVPGPVSGTRLGIYELVLPVVYESMFFYAGIVFYGALVFYMFLKSRERSRKPPAGAAPPGGSPGRSDSPPDATAASGSSSAATPAKNERACPNCQAIVYPNESTCWKCGKPLPLSS